MEELSKEAIEARRKYRREWNRRNPEKVKQHQISYWERIAEKEKEAKADADANDK